MREKDENQNCGEASLCNPHCSLPHEANPSGHQQQIKDKKKKASAVPQKVVAIQHWGQVSKVGIFPGENS